MRSATSGAFWLRPRKPVGGLASEFGGMSAPGSPMRQASTTCSAALFSAACCDGGGTKDAAFARRAEAEALPCGDDVGVDLFLEPAALFSAGSGGAGAEEDADA